ncbi:MAG: glutathione peroxidase [Gammaproteobacteria bacterium]|nr:glutathione peroxidase [Gammaproteobacteria bacterium]
MSKLYTMEMNSISGESVSLSEYRDQVLLIVNLASQCGLTPQYAGLCTLHEQGEVKVLGFPCNQFGAQEPGTDEQILEFATSRFDVSFPIFSKIEVNGDNACELYQWLKSEKPNPDGKADIAWNFTKFLIGKDGSVLARFEPQVSPEDIGTQLDNFL